MVRTYKHRLYPTPEQEAALGNLLWVACWLYNAALSYRRQRWRESRRRVTYFEQAAMWRDWRNEDPDENPLRILNMTAGQQVLRRLDHAFRAFFRGQRGYPRFKQLRYFNSLNYKPGDGSALHGRKLYVQNVGRITVRWHRVLPDGKLKNIILLHKPSGWYVCFQVQLPTRVPKTHLGPAIGLDMGIRHALALSDGTVFDSPQYLKQSLKKLRRLQRTVARRKKGSQGRRKAVHQLAKQQEHISNQRRDWWHKITHHLVDAYGKVVLEDLQLSFMLQNGHLSRAVYDVGLGMFRELLDYKAMEAGVAVVAVNPAYTSQICSGCGGMVPKGVSVRVHACPACGLMLDRDINAAVNILSAGTRPPGVNVSRRAVRSLGSSLL
jgi:putative transposase